MEGWDPKYRIKVRIVCARAYHALFMRNMLIRPTEQELKDFGEPDFTIFNGFIILYYVYFKLVNFLRTDILLV